MKTRVPALLTAGALSLSLAACGGGASAEPEETADAAGGEGGGGGVTSLLADLAASTEAVDNYTLDMSMTVSDPEAGETEMDFTYEVMDEPQAAQVTVYMPAMGDMLLELAELSGRATDLTAEELSTSVVIVPAGGDMLISNHNGLQEVDTAWARGVDSSGLQPVTETMFDTSNLPELAGAVAAIETIEEAGTEEISGVGTTRLEGSFTAEEIDALTEEQSGALSDLIGDTTGAMDVSIWIADDGFPMRMDFNDGAGELSMVFSALGETSFELPSEDEITDV
ncbi:hypothetical protein ACIBFB_18090 [Nocardiopsis sp. NPDC050513]|uniref:hypothetical protein n=1 Tax=Nocardiopsis sp. NPDC050513 TaxID=3364338 RepID=UPI0037BD6DB2